MRFLRQNYGRSLFILLAFSFVHSVGSKLAISNLPNVFSWLLWLFISFYLMLYAFEFVCCLLAKPIQTIAVNFGLFK